MQPDERSRSRDFIKSLFVKGLCFFGKLRRLSGIPILYYHSVDETNSLLSISESDFYWQMKYLRDEGFKVISLRRLFEEYLNRNGNSDRVVVLTFDDGFQNNFRTALPILAKFEHSATVFLTTDCIGSKATWIKRDLTEIITNFSGDSPLDCANTSELDIDFAKLRGMYPFLARLSNEELRAVVHKLSLAGDMSLMSWDEVKEMNSCGIDVGAHSCSHPHFGKLGLEEIRKEVFESKTVIESKLGSEVQFFCYPYAGVDSRAKRVVQEAGYRGACSTATGVFDPSSDPYSINRFHCGGFDGRPSYVKLYLSGFSNTYFSIRRAKRHIAHGLNRAFKKNSHCL